MSTPLHPESEALGWGFVFGFSSVFPRTPFPALEARMNDRGSRMALCLWWPGFELELERVRGTGLEERPLALPDAGSGTRCTIGMACALASGKGVAPGMLISQAIALCPSLVLVEPDPDLYDAASGRIFELLRGFSPVVERAPDRGRFFVGVDGLERLCGSPERQIEHLRSSLTALSPWLAASARFGYAPGKFAAWVAARSTLASAAGRAGVSPVVVPPSELPTFLAEQPIGVLPVSPRMIGRLRRLGVERLDRLVAIPEPALVAQFGADGRRALAWAKGARIDRVRPEPHERTVRVALDFPVALGQLELLHAALDRLLHRALKRSTRVGRSVRGIKVSARLEDGGSWSIRAILRDPTSRLERLGAFLRSRIALSPPPRAVERLQLEFFRFGPASAQVGLFDPKRDAPRTSGSIETADGALLPALDDAARLLRMRLGRGTLYRVLALQPTSRLPERRHALLEIA